MPVTEISNPGLEFTIISENGKGGWRGGGVGGGGWRGGGEVERFDVTMTSQDG